MIEFFDRLDQTEVALLDQIEELHASAEIALRDADDQTQVRFAQALLGGNVAVRNADGELSFLVGAEKRHPADLLEVYLDGIIHGQTGFRRL